MNKPTSDTFEGEYTRNLETVPYLNDLVEVLEEFLDPLTDYEFSESFRAITDLLNKESFDRFSIMKKK